MHEEDDPEARLQRDFDADFARLKALLDGPGRGPFLRSPVLLPDDHWFPDAWEPDIEGARCLLLRLMTYAGLAQLQVECTHLGRRFDETSTFDDGLGAMAACFRGIEGGRALFGVRGKTLGDPEFLAGVMAHEVAHVWRRVRGIEVADPAEEEQLTDLTTVALGFGVLSANASYHYSASASLHGVLQMTQFTHRVSGYLGPDRLARLLGIQCLVRGEDVTKIRGRLGTTQQAAFDALSELTSRDELREMLNLPPHEFPGGAAPAAPEPTTFPPSAAAQIVHECVARAVAELGDAGGLFPRPLPLTISPIQARYRSLGRWGRAHLDGGWLTELLVIEDPEWECRLIAQVTADRRETSTWALGVVDGETVKHPRELRMALEPLFEDDSRSQSIAREVPSFVEHMPRSPLDINDLGSLLSLRLARLDARALASDVEAFTTLRRSLTRIEQESEWAPDFPPGATFDSRPLISRWWKYASDPYNAADERETWFVKNRPRPVQQAPAVQ